MNFKPQIITKQSINNRKVHEVNHIDITHGEDEVEINETHVRKLNYKGKNYDPNYQQNRTKTNTNTITTLHQVTTILETKVTDTTKQPTGETSKCICHTTWTGQQGTAVQDPGGTMTSITVQR